MTRPLTFMFAAALLAGCASKPITPDWVDGQAAKYPAGQYLIGRGSASTSEQAQERARADLAKIFQVAVAAESEDVQSFSRDSANGAAGGQYEERTARRITTRTEQIVRGIRIAELWQDPATKTHHALAVLQRLPAANALREEINRLDAATRQYVQQSRAASDVFVKIGAASRAIESQTEREGFQRSLKVVDITGRGIESEFSSSQLIADRDALLKRVRISPRIPAGADPELESIVRGALAASGFLTEGGDKPDFVLEARMTLNDLGRKEGWYWQRGSIEVTLIEAAANRVRGTKSWIIKGSALNAAEARQRALQEADSMLKKDLRRTLTGFATNG